MTPPAFLALWNGVLPERAGEYEAWHSLEHMPERLGSPGFTAASRYRAEEGGDYFTLYEFDSLAVLDTPAYAALVDKPTAWSTRMRPTLTGFSRMPCDTLFAQRSGKGGALITLRFAGAAADAWPLLEARVTQALENGEALGAIFGGSTGTGETYRVFPDAAPPGIESLLILEGTEPRALQPLADAVTALLPARPTRREWRLLQSMTRAELSAPDAARQPAREALLRQWVG